MPASRPVAVPPVPIEVRALRPSDYTAALVQVLRAEAGRIRGARALDVGCGSGVILAVLGDLGAAHLCGIDIEKAADDVSARGQYLCGGVAAGVACGGQRRSVRRRARRSLEGLRRCEARG